MREETRSDRPERPAVPGRMEAPAIDELPHSPIPPDDAVAEPTTQSLTQRQLAWRRFRRHKPAMVSLIVLILMGVAEHQRGSARQILDMARSPGRSRLCANPP